MFCNCVCAQSDKLSIKLKINNIEKEIYFSKSSVVQLQKRKIYNKRINKIIEFGGIKDSLLFSPSGIKTDKRGNIFILDYVGRFVKKFSTNGKLIKQYGRSGRGPGEFLTPFRIYLDVQDSLYVYDNQNMKLTAFLEKIYEFNTTNGLFIEFCPISKWKIIILKGEPNSVELMETRNINGKLLSKFENLLEKKVIPPESFYLANIIAGNILRLSSSRIVHIPEYYNQLIFYNENKIERITSTVDGPSNPLFKIESRGKGSILNFNDLEKYQINHNSFVINNDIYVLSKPGTKNKKLMFDIYSSENGSYKYSIRIPIPEDFYIIHMTDNKIYLITTEMKVAIYSYE